MESLAHILLCGIAIGVLISAPMGPIGMLVIQRTLSKGRWQAFFTGLGAALSDLFYCLLTGFCLSFVTDFMEANQAVLRIIGSVVLAAFGIYLFVKNPTRSLKPADGQGRNFWTNFVTGFLFTFSNPFILLMTMGLFAQFNFIMPDYGFHHFVVAYASILGGAVLWWYLVTFLVSALRSRFNVRALWLVNRIIGSILIFTAALSMYSAIVILSA